MTPYLAELKLLWRAGSARWLVFLYFVLSLAVAFAGREWLAAKQQHIDQVEQHFQAQVRHWQSEEAPDPGYIGYYLFMPAVFELSPWAALISGERVEQTVQKRIRLLALHGQLYGGDLHNHEHLRLGRLDLAFVWVYLLPLLIGILCVNLVADDRACGRWLLVAGLTPSPSSLIRRRLVMRFGLIAAVNALALGVASVIIGAAIDKLWFGVLALLLTYQSFWFAMAGWIVHLNKDATFNVLSYLGLWLVFSFVLPVALYVARMDSSTLNDGIAVVVEQRQAMNDSWDEPKQAAFDEFLQQFPQWQDTAPLPEGFHWKWYYAMQQISDVKVAGPAESYQSRILSAYKDSSAWRWISPPLNLQFALSKIANTDRTSYEDYLQQIVKWHQRLRDFWYPYYFFDKSFDPSDLENIPEFRYRPGAEVSLAQPLAAMLLISAIFALIPRAPRRRMKRGTGTRLQNGH